MSIGKHWSETSACEYHKWANFVCHGITNSTDIALKELYDTLVLKQVEAKAQYTQN